MEKLLQSGLAPVLRKVLTYKHFDKILMDSSQYGKLLTDDLVREIFSPEQIIKKTC